MKKIVIDTQFCKACGLCVTACPRSILQLGRKINQAGYHYAVAEDDTNCISCGICALHCPDIAISVYKEES